MCKWNYVHKTICLFRHINIWWNWVISFCIDIIKYCIFFWNGMKKMHHTCSCYYHKNKESACMKLMQLIFNIQLIIFTLNLIKTIMWIKPTASIIHGLWALFSDNFILSVSDIIFAFDVPWCTIGNWFLFILLIATVVFILLYEYFSHEPLCGPVCSHH